MATVNSGLLERDFDFLLKRKIIAWLAIVWFSA